MIRLRLRIDANLGWTAFAAGLAENILEKGARRFSRDSANFVMIMVANYDVARHVPTIRVDYFVIDGTLFYDK